jgi:hypothetical protein
MPSIWKQRVMSELERVLRSFSPFSSSGSQKRCPELDLLQEVRRVSFRCIFFCSSDQRSSGLLTKIVAAVRALCVLEKAVAAAAVAPPDCVRPAWHVAAVIKKERKNLTRSGHLWRRRGLRLAASSQCVNGLFRSLFCGGGGAFFSCY